MLRVAERADLPSGMIIRYGYPKLEKILESKTLTSRNFVLSKNPQLSRTMEELQEKKKKLKKGNPEIVEINKAINKIYEVIQNEERELIQNTAFLATTVSKAVVDNAVYGQTFDVVIFDEASMAYVPQIVFSAALAKSFFICLGDFKQLPAIVQNYGNELLKQDIFEYVGITEAVDKGYEHNWLVMLDTQHRMHIDIANFISQHMYNDLLKTADEILKDRTKIAKCSPSSGNALSLVDLSGMYSVCRKTMDGSRFNILSALISVRLAETFLAKYDVAIITPYSAQSRLMLSMVRDCQEKDERWKKVSSATVHQFQGSEKSVVIYDAVDCYRMPYPGMLLTSLKNDNANRLFNVALTRAKGKFIMVANIDYFKRKKISKNLVFYSAISYMNEDEKKIIGVNAMKCLSSKDDNDQMIYISDRKNIWERYVEDLRRAKGSIRIYIPDVIDEDEDSLPELMDILEKKQKEGVEVVISLQEEIDIPGGLNRFVKRKNYVLEPLTLIDKDVVWFGQPLYAADFIAEGEIIDTEVFPCLRFNGASTYKFIKAYI